ncbi:MAG TPA: OsmC family protein [Caulobacterales bacterium]|nr:OsmC family protein [Caulobacterales bacterium]
MATYVATVSWKRGDQPFADGKYSRAHTISFDSGLTVDASSSPHVVRVPMSREDAVDPEELLVAALSSCHMLSFLYVAKLAGFVVDSYLDIAEGVMTKNEAGQLWISKTTLRPAIAWVGKTPSADELEHLHHRAHEECFIASSYKGEVLIEPPR